MKFKFFFSALIIHTSINCLQKLDGFLALLSITGGSWSPPMQKLPFSVTCVDGESSLLYYASIDLAGNVMKKKIAGDRRRKNASLDDGSVTKSRFRIPVSGRVQLVSLFRKLVFDRRSFFI